MSKDKICGTCRWHSREKGTGSYICTNELSDCYTYYTGFRDGCDDWEERDE